MTNSSHIEDLSNWMLVWPTSAGQTTAQTSSGSLGRLARYSKAISIFYYKKIFFRGLKMPNFQKIGKQILDTLAKFMF
ncbi:unnamed protein product [Blepharisma stoltei]|uniref:Uncharacterized protein n=1 Tax=Blepharisma stoltei TaxID=1481888 RepID=A0AAU9K202_9CILI|nr:unnamed protein product [Blepharisma stoltei]